MTEAQAGESADIRRELLDCRGHALVIGGPGSGKTTVAPTGIDFEK